MISLKYIKDTPKKTQIYPKGMKKYTKNKLNVSSK